MMTKFESVFARIERTRRVFRFFNQFSPDLLVRQTFRLEEDIDVAVNRDHLVIGGKYHAFTIPFDRIESAVYDNRNFPSVTITLDGGYQLFFQFQKHGNWGDFPEDDIKYQAYYKEGYRLVRITGESE